MEGYVSTKDCKGLEILGTNASETLIGTQCSDKIEGLAGSDTIYGLSGSDTIYGEKDSPVGNNPSAYNAADLIYAGAGKDLVYAGAGNDTVYGEEGDDSLNGGYHDDLLYGGDGDDSIVGDGENQYSGGLTLYYGNDTIHGGAGNDMLHGLLGNDLLYGDEGNDFLEGGRGNDLLSGGEGDDTLSGAVGDDTLQGGEGNDVLESGMGKDRLYGDGGDDYFMLKYGGGESLSGGTGVDTLDYGTSSADIVANIANIHGNFLVFLRKADGTLTPVSFTAAVSKVSHTSGADALSAGNGTQTVVDILSDMEDFENIITGSGNDKIGSNYSSNYIETGAGDDTVHLARITDQPVIDNDTVITGEGNDFVFLTHGFVDGNFYTGQVHIEMGNGNDTIYGGTLNASVYIDAGAGDDEIAYRALNSEYSEIYGGAGNDTIVAGHPSSDGSIFHGGEGDDIFYLGQGSPSTLNSNDCYIYGGSGADIFVVDYLYNASYFNGNASSAEIFDFAAGEDKIDMTEVSSHIANAGICESFEDLDIQYDMVAESTTITFYSWYAYEGTTVQDKIILYNTMETLVESDFIF